MKQKTDYIFFGLTGLLIVSTLILSQLYDYVLSINNYLAFVAWPIALFLRLKVYKSSRYGLGIVLMLALFNIINFGIGAISMKFGINSSIPIETPGINPIILLIVIAYYIINKKRINNIILETKEAKSWNNFPSNGIAIASNGSGDLLLLMPTNDDEKKLAEHIYLWQHDDGGIYEVAKSIDDLQNS